jgi:hypothetical protein
LTLTGVSAAAAALIVRWKDAEAIGSVESDVLHLSSVEKPAPTATAVHVDAVGSALVAPIVGNHAGGAISPTDLAAKLYGNCGYCGARLEDRWRPVVGEGLPAGVVDAICDVKVYGTPRVKSEREEASSGQGTASAAATAKRPRLADLAPGADGSCTESMKGLASESTSTLSVTPNIEAAATNRPAACAQVRVCARAHARVCEERLRAGQHDAQQRGVRV